ncbi:MAG: hypothetical protein DHS20C15_24190 [Planctomycetota bacterium]|nr:MAG: hypothetical protein DHS20C15_24190 [Planctomycetota bacterium]
MLRREPPNTGANDWALRFWRGTAAGTFEPGASLPTGAPLFGGVVADVNGDGLLDTVMERQGGHALAVLLNEGDGVFSFASEYKPPASVIGIRAGDLDADGLDDVVVLLTSTVSPAVRLLALRSLGDGTLEQGTSIVLEQKVVDFQIHDFTGDGLLDVLVSRSKNDSLVLLAGDGTGDLTPVPALDLAGERTEFLYVYVVDLDRDGLDDLVATLINPTLSIDATAGLAVWKALGPGEFAPPAFQLEPYALPSPQIADINADGFLDLTDSVSWGALRIFHGLGDTTFEAPEAYSELGASGSPAFADFDGDGIPDLLFLHSGVLLHNRLFD